MLWSTIILVRKEPDTQHILTPLLFYTIIFTISINKNDLLALFQTKLENEVVASDFPQHNIWNSVIFFFNRKSGRFKDLCNFTIHGSPLSFVSYQQPRNHRIKTTSKMESFWLPLPHSGLWCDTSSKLVWYRTMAVGIALAFW